MDAFSSVPIQSREYVPEPNGVIFFVDIKWLIDACVMYMDEKVTVPKEYAASLEKTFFESHHIDSMVRFLTYITLTVRSENLL
jgi:hypothetical protein